MNLVKAGDGLANHSWVSAHSGQRFKRVDRSPEAQRFEIWMSTKERQQPPSRVVQVGGMERLPLGYRS